jgi:hypothetical protein
MSGTQPDFVNQHAIKAFYYANLLQSMEPFMQLDPDFDRTDFHYSAHAFNLIGDEFWSLSCSVLGFHLFYNRDMFEAHGLDPDRPPERWSEMIEMQKIFTLHDALGRVSQTGFAAIHLDATGAWPYHTVGTFNGTDFFDPYAHVRITVDNESTYQLIQFYRDLGEAYGHSTSRLAAGFSTMSSIAAFTAGRVAMNLEYRTAEAIGKNFSVGVGPFPSSDFSAPHQYQNIYPQDTYMILKDAKNPMGAWFYLRWYNRVGIVMVVENYNYQLDPSTYFPRFMTNTYTRMRIGEIYSDEISQDTRRNIQLRDEAMLNHRMTYNFEPTIREQRDTAFDRGIAPIIQNPTLNQDVRGRLAQIQNQVDSLRDNWLRRHEAAGWIFPDDFPWGISPRMQDVMAGAD